MNNIVLVNRNNSIDLNYIPDDLEPCDYRTNGHFYYGSCIRRETLINFLKLRRDALKSNYDIYVFSGFRGSKQQNVTFTKCFENNLLILRKEYPYESEEELRKKAYLLTIKKVALPGQSEHQTGLAIDITCFYNHNYSEDISNKSEIEWMKDNAHKYGFILRYPQGKENITGYNFEPWHYRYVGEEYSFDIKKNDFTLEEFYERVLKK